MFTRLLERLATALDLAKIPYMIIGGQAVLLYGEPRLTRDIDVTLGIDGIASRISSHSLHSLPSHPWPILQPSPSKPWCYPAKIPQRAFGLISFFPTAPMSSRPSVVRPR
ncbi:MAG: hypothetical protein OJF50_006041 [Nitrospira sp.]|nr:hypothetical protein [Nitrospira sp.]